MSVKIFFEAVFNALCLFGYAFLLGSIISVIIF